MDTKRIKLSDSTIVDTIKDWMENTADADELARIAGEIFGGICYYEGEGLYFFEPNENYYGGFGN
jgi:hypothetical protein